ncbi:hypothetical protein VM1G_07494 [Cytospora mali]|uniref:BTB domain-containing protein n=1 Tax=Cytospora mali TaxID=578113 RepID=A0A194W7V1_CYTMA|nr:hypothetical protein VM1G_07494 [Valsa mali]
MSQESRPISESLTVIITTSPTPSAPSTELLDTILSSFQEFCPALLPCRVVVVFDTFDRIAAANRLKKGSVTAEGAKNFPTYKENVKKLILQQFAGRGGPEDVSIVEEEGQAEFGSPCMPGNFTSFTVQRTEDKSVIFIEPSERLGFGLAVRSAVRMVETPYVWVQQHDWKLHAGIPIQSILEVMMSSSEEVPVKYVCLPSPRMLGYAESAHVNLFPGLRELTSSLKRDFSSSVGEKTKVVPLTPLFFWHDKTHIASTEHYLSRIFPSRLAMPRGAFIEDHIGQRARNQMKEGILLESGILSDAEVHCGSRTWKEAQTGVVRIETCTENEADLLLQYLYTGVVDVGKYLPGESPIISHIKVWKIADFFCLPDLRHLALHARDDFLKRLIDSYGPKPFLARPVTNIPSIRQVIEFLYEEDRDDIRGIFRRPYLATLLLDSQHLAKNEDFQELIGEVPEFGSDWALGLMAILGHIRKPKDYPALPKCDKCGKFVAKHNINPFKWVQKRQIELFCRVCNPVPTWEDCVGKLNSSKSTRPLQ